MTQQIRPLVKSESVGIMFCLDSILDTRHGTIKKTHPELFDRIRNSAKYYLRKTDRWDKIHPSLDNTLLSLRYSGRNVETIKNSQLTMVVRAAIDLITDVIEKIKDNNPHIAAFYFVINVYPYNLTVELITEIARKFLIQLGYPDAPIGFVNKPFKEIGPAFLKEQNIRYWYCYHYEEWLRDNFEPLHGKEPSSSDQIVGSPETKMFVPMLAQDQEGVDKFLDELDEKIYIDQFTLVKVIFRNIVEFEFLPVSTFCTIDVEKFTQLEKSLEMEKSEVLAAGQTAVKEIMNRVGDTDLPNSDKVNQILEHIGSLVYSLKVNNNKDNINIFKTELALMNFQLMKLYNLTPFNAGEDLEEILNQMVLTVDTSEEDYLCTETHWNQLGVKTIKREITLDNNEIIYRCICAEDTEIKGYSVIKAGQILPQHPEKTIRAKAADFVALQGYFA